MDRCSGKPCAQIVYFDGQSYTVGEFAAMLWRIGADYKTIRLQIVGRHVGGVGSVNLRRLIGAQHRTRKPSRWDVEVVVDGRRAPVRAVNANLRNQGLSYREVARRLGQLTGMSFCAGSCHKAYHRWPHLPL